MTAPLERIAYSHRHTHEFLPVYNETFKLCTDRYCTAIQHENGTITYNNNI